MSTWFAVFCDATAGAVSVVSCFNYQQVDDSPPIILSDLNSVFFRLCEQQVDFFLVIIDNVKASFIVFVQSKNQIVVKAELQKM